MELRSGGRQAASEGVEPADCRATPTTAARLLATFAATDVDAPLTPWTPAEWQAVLAAQIARNTRSPRGARDSAIIYRYHAGDPIADIAHDYGLTKSGIGNVLAQHGVLRTRNGGNE